VRLRQLLAGNQDLARRVESLEKRAGSQDAHLRALSEAFRGLVETKPPATKRKRIGYEVEPARDTGHGNERGPKGSKRGGSLPRGARGR